MQTYALDRAAHPHDLEVSRANPHLFFAAVGRGVDFYDLRTSALAVQTLPHGAEVRRLAHFEEHALLTGSENGKLKIYDLRFASQSKKLASLALRDPINSIRCQKKMLAIATNEGLQLIGIKQTQAPKLLLRFDLPARVNDLYFENKSNERC